jgi:MFS family permease
MSASIATRLEAPASQPSAPETAESEAPDIFTLAPAPVAPAPPPATVIHPPALAACYIAASVLFWATQGLGMNFVSANTTQLQGGFGATLTETNWLVAAYMAPNVSLTLLLMKVRAQFGLRRFAICAIAAFVAASLLHLFVRDLHAMVAVRFLAGCAAAPISTLGFLYMLEAFPPARKLSWGLSLALFCSSATPIVARLISPTLLDTGLWSSLAAMEAGLALLCIPVVTLLPLSPIPHTKVLHVLDFISYPLIALGFGLLAVVLSLGRLYWWLEIPWLGWCTALAILAIAAAAAIEVNRDEPLMDLHWLLSPRVLHLAAVLLVFRIALAEQTSGAFALFQAVGLLNEQSATLCLIILLSSFIAGIVCALLLRPERTPMLHALALLLIAAGALMDSQATNLTRPAQMYVSQALISFGGALFLPPSMLTGMMAALQRSQATITSFIVIFLFTQSVGGLMGSALFGSFVIVREKFHSSQLVEHLVLSDAGLAGHLHLLSDVYAKVLTDPQLLNAEGIALLAQRATLEATILAYGDAFRLIAAIASLAFAILVIHLIVRRLRHFAAAWARIS